MTDQKPDQSTPYGSEGPGTPFRSADPRFPDRPTSPDFWLLSEAAIAMDRRADAGGSVSEIMAELADMVALEYLMRHRMRMAADRHGLASKALIMAQAGWMDGFAIGVLFAQAGGHVDE